MRLKAATRVVVHFDEDGNADYMADGPVDFYVVDERCPRDRVYKFTDPQVPEQKITEILGTSRVGMLGDMPGVEAEIKALVDGEPAPRTRLSVVPPNED